MKTSINHFTKRIILIMVMVFGISVISSAQASFKFVESSHDFGTFKEGEKAEAIFEFVNTGTEPLIIYNAKASCGCTTPVWPKEPIMPGKKGVIKVAYDSKGKVYPFQKSILISSNAQKNGKPDNVELFIKGNVIE